MKTVIDTNIIIDALTNREPYCKNAQRILLLAEQKLIGGFITSNTATDIYYLLHKYFHDSAKVKSIMEILFDSISVIPVNETDCKSSLHSKISDYEDAVLESAAKNNGADCIITRNEKDFSFSRVPVYSPDDFLLNASSLSL